MADTRDDIEAVGKVLQLDPVHGPEHTDYRVQLDDGELSVVLGDCAALGDDPRRPRGGLTTTPEAPGFEHVARAVNPRARVAELVHAHDITTFDLSARPRTPVEITCRRAPE